MNFLAHTYLSGNNDEILIGNFIGDYVKGKRYDRYPEMIRKGILMHRDIDTFTDYHSITKRSRMRIISKYHKYAGIVIDIFYDHFLASSFDKYSNLPLEDYVSYAYLILKRNYRILPISIKYWFPTFLENNWMMAYTTVEGIERVLDRMSANTSLPNHSAYAIEVLREEYDAFTADFEEFFPLIIKFLEEKYKIDISGQRYDYAAG
jgi:acyl carrier protein phosphodiesterase